MAFLPVAAESIFRNYEESHFPFTSPQDFQAGAGVPDLLMRRSSGMDPAEEFHADDDGSDDGSQMLGEKKRRLNLEQVKALEKSFELGNKLEPERKMQLARALGLQPRQIAIWFQNRRARWKTKQLEKDYDILKRQFDALKADNDALKSQNKKLHTQLLGLRSREPTGSGEINLNKENEGNCWSNGNETACEVNVKTSSTTDSRLYLNHHHRHKRNKQHGFPTAQEVVHSSSRPDLPVSNFPNMFGSIQDSQEFWPWSDHHQNFQ